ERGRKENYRQGSKAEEKTPKALIAIYEVVWDWSYMANKGEDHALVADAEAPAEFTLMANTESKNLHNLIESQRFDKVKEGVGYNAVPPPAADLYLSSKKDLSCTGLPEFVNDTVTDNSRPLSTVASTSAEGPEFVLNKKACFNCGDISHLANDCRKRVQRDTTRTQKHAYESPSHRSGGHRPHGAPIRPPHRSDGHRPHGASMRPSHRPAGHRPHDPSMNPMRPNMNSARPNRSFFIQAHSYENRYFLKSSAVKTQYRAPWVPTVNRNNPPVNRKFSTGRRKFPTVNRKFPTASRKFTTGSTKTHTTDMGRKGKAVKPQLGSSQNNIDDKDSKCIVLGRNFKLLDDANILLRTPRQHNMYSIDLNNIVPHKDLTCLVAKASADECIRWHRRLGHLNVKIMNKLVRHNLVRGLPTKRFNNDHTCTACLKGKQHKASCKSKRNRILIEAARTMLAEAKLPATFWAEAVNTSYYVQNRVLVNKSQNKTPYKLFNGRTPAIGFLKPFGSHVMILNTLDNLGKFEAKGDEGYFIRYSMSSKAFRVFNKRTRRVEENLHVEFLENKAIDKSDGPNWLFDIDSLTKSMNYVPVDAGTNSTNFLGTKDAANQEVNKDVSSLRYILLPNWAHDALLKSSSSKPHDESSTKILEGSGNSNPTASSSNPPAEQMETLTVESLIPTVSSPVPTTCLNDSPEPFSEARLISKRVANQEESPSLDNILSLTNRFEDILRVTTSSNEAIGVEADVSNMETSITASPTPTLRIHKDHPKSQIIGHVDTPIQTRHKIVAQGHIQEEGIDYDEVFAPVARIEAIRLFLAYVSFMCFAVYQMDVKSAFLYGTIDEEVYVMQPLGFQDLAFPAKVYKVEKAIEFEALMHEKFQMSAMGDLNFFLGLQVLQKEDGIFLLQDKYIGDILKKFGYSDVRSSNTPMDKDNPWGKDETGKDVDLHLYRSMIGYLMYLTTSRPDIMFAVLAYSDSDYCGASRDRKSTTGGKEVPTARAILPLPVKKCSRCRVDELPLLKSLHCCVLIILKDPVSEFSTINSVAT
nr:ribonuclease H-like domain-containing protein [Tanacetum cinerariifolium]